MNPNLRWYLQRDGRAAGPYSLEDLKNQVRQGLLLGHDLVFMEGAEEWKRAFDWAELAAEIFSEERTSFTRLFNLPRAEGAPPEDWIVLIRFEEPDGLRFKQEGPYPTEKVRELLQNKKLKPSDHVWKTGFDKWAPVYTREEFSASLWNVKEESVPLLKEVVETPVKQAPKEEIPVEAEKPAAIPVAGPASLPPAIDAEAVKSFALPQIPAPDLIDEEESPIQQTRSTVRPEFTRSQAVDVEPEPESHSEPLPAMPLPIVARGGFKPQWAVMTIALALAGAFFYLKHNPQTNFPFKLQGIRPADPAELTGGDAAPEMNLPPAQAEVNPQMPPAQETAATPAPTPALPPPQMADPAKAAAENQAPAPAKQVLWNFRAQGDVGTTAALVITGYSGRVLDVPAVNLKASFRLTKRSALEVDPKALQIPEGSYFVQVFQNGKLVDKGQKEYILDSQRFEKRLAQHRKQIAFDQQQEKRNLLKAVDGLQRFISEEKNSIGQNMSPKAKAAQWKAFAQLERPEMKKIRQARHSLMYASGWASLASQYDSVKEIIQAKGPRRPAAKQDLEALRKKLGSLRAQVSQTSLATND